MIKYCFASKVTTSFGIDAEIFTDIISSGEGGLGSNGTSHVANGSSYSCVTSSVHEPLKGSTTG
jgi:hypothetical protein